MFTILDNTDFPKQEERWQKRSNEEKLGSHSSKSWSWSSLLVCGLHWSGLDYLGKVSSAKQKAAKAQIELFGTALDTFRIDVGRYPTTEEGLKALREKPSGAEEWQGPYLPKEIPLDPWGRPYIYKSPGEHGDYDLVSYGRDGVQGGEGEDEDIVSWKDVGK